MDTKRIEAAAESSLAKWSVRFVFGIAAFLAINKLTSLDNGMDEIKQDVAELRAGQSKQDVKIAEINGKVDGINTRIDSALIYRMDEIQKRVERLEEATKTP